jgi:hypothetical protein
LSGLPISHRSENRPSGAISAATSMCVDRRRRTLGTGKGERALGAKITAAADRCVDYVDGGSPPFACLAKYTPLNDRPAASAVSQPVGRTAIGVQKPHAARFIGRDYASPDTRRRHFRPLAPPFELLGGSSDAARAASPAAKQRSLSSDFPRSVRTRANLANPRSVLAWSRSAVIATPAQNAARPFGLATLHL